MIDLFYIQNHNIDTSIFSNILHDQIVNKFCDGFCDYVGAKYGCPINSASSAIFLLSKYADEFGITKFTVPSIIPPVVINSIINGGCDWEFVDDVKWVGGPYHLSDIVVDSAQHVARDQCRFLSDDILTIFSFYPTKPVGGVDGGMVCSHNPDIIDFLRVMVMNGTRFSINNWDRRVVGIGWKMYMNSVQAYVANENLKTLDDRKDSLQVIRDIYNAEFGLTNSSDHLYRIEVTNNTEFLKAVDGCGIRFGIHYAACHSNHLYRKDKAQLPQSERVSSTTISIPYHHKLTSKEISEVIKCVIHSGMLVQSN